MVRWLLAAMSFAALGAGAYQVYFGSIMEACQFCGVSFGLAAAARVAYFNEKWRP